MHVRHRKSIANVQITLTFAEKASRIYMLKVEKYTKMTTNKYSSIFWKNNKGKQTMIKKET